MVTQPQQHCDNLDHILLDPPTTAKLIGGTKPLSVDTLAVWRSTKRYNLAYIKIGSSVRYRKSEVLRFIREREFSPE